MRRVLPLIACAACLSEGGEYQYGVQLADLELVVTSPTMAVHPDTSINDIEDNPFVDGAGEARWQTLGEGLYIPALYAWGSELVLIPEGERQYYAAFCAHQIYVLGLADADNQVWMREIAIGGYQTLLDEFPDAVTYDETGTVFWRLAPLAYQGIVDLGGTVEGGWVPVEGSDGSFDVVQP